MKNMDEEYQYVMVDMGDLYGRGWTERMIEKLLGKPCWIVGGWGNRYKMAYCSAHVEAVESSAAFREQFLKSAKRRKLDNTRVQEALDRSQELEQQGAVAVWQTRVEVMRLAEEKEMAEYEERVQVDRTHSTRSSWTWRFILLVFIGVKTR